MNIKTQTISCVDAIGKCRKRTKMCCIARTKFHKTLRCHNSVSPASSRWTANFVEMSSFDGYFYSQSYLLQTPFKYSSVYSRPKLVF